MTYDLVIKIMVCTWFGLLIGGIALAIWIFSGKAPKWLVDDGEGEPPKAKIVYDERDIDDGQK